MANPHEFLVGKDPVKEQLSCPKCGSMAEYNSGNQYICELCGFSGYLEKFKKKQVATVDWEKFARACGNAF